MSSSPFKRSLRLKMLRGILVLQLLLVAIFVGILLMSSRNNLALHAQKVVEHSQGSYDMVLQGDIKMLSAALDSFGTNAAVRQLYVDHQDRTRLLAAIQDLYRSNKVRYGITHFYFIDKDGSCFLRAHQPDLYGDAILRDTFQQARASGKTVSGIELGKTAFALRTVTPYIHNGTVVGYVEFGEEINHFDQLLKQEMGVDVAVLVDKRFLDEQAYRKTVKSAGKADNWDQFKAYALVSSTLKDTMMSTDLVPEDRLRTVRGAEYLGTVPGTDGLVMAKGAFPLKDAAGKQVGVVLTLSDVTTQVRSDRSALWILLLIAAAVFVGSLIAGMTYLRVELIGPIVKLAEHANDISLGQVELKLETDREDEIGQLIRSFERMRISLKKSLAMLSRNS